MYQTLVDQAPLIQFPVVNAGVLVTGLSGVFTVSVVSPSGVLLSPAPAVAESVVPGIYGFTVPQAFLGAQGAGNYALVVAVSAPALVVSDVLVVTDEPSDIRLAVTYDASGSLLRCNLWVERSVGQQTTGLTNATVRLFDRAGAPLTGLVTAAAADANGVFGFSFAAPAFAVGDTETYFDCTVADAGPPVRTRRGKVGVTFSRAS